MSSCSVVALTDCYHRFYAEGKQTPEVVQLKADVHEYRTALEALGLKVQCWKLCVYARARVCMSSLMMY